MIRTMAFSPNGKQLITGGLFPFARLWDVSSPTPTWKNLVASRYAPSARLSQSTTDGKTIQTFPVAGAAAWMWDAASGKQVGLPLLHRGRVLAVAFSPDGKSVLTASADGSARLWDATTLQSKGKSLQHQNSILCVAFSPDGKAVVTGSATRPLTSGTQSAAGLSEILLYIKRKSRL